MSLVYGQNTYSRIAHELVFNTIRTKLSQEIGLQDASGIVTGLIPTSKIHLENPPQIYVNSRSQDSNNIDRNRFPAIALYTANQDVSYSMSKAKVVVPNTTGLVKQYVPNMLVHHDVNIAVYTLTKKEDRVLLNQTNQFFERYRNGMLILNDELTGIGFNLTQLSQSQLMTESAPYIRSHFVRLQYQVFAEKMTYIMKNFNIKFSVAIDELETNSTTGQVTDNISYSSTGMVSG